MALLTSPVGEIVWMAAQTPHTDKKTGKETYSVKLALDPKSEFVAAVKELNKAKVVTAKSYRGESEHLQAILDSGKVLIEARSKFKPTVYDANGNELEDAPMFFSGSTGTAQMIVQPYTSEKGGTINLIGIIIHTVTSPEGSTTEGGSDRETRLAQLRAAVEAATKG